MRGRVVLGLCVGALIVAGCAPESGGDSSSSSAIPTSSTASSSSSAPAPTSSSPTPSPSPTPTPSPSPTPSPTPTPVPPELGATGFWADAKIPDVYEWAASVANQSDKDAKVTVTAFPLGKSGKAVEVYDIDGNQVKSLSETIIVGAWSTVGLCPDGFETDSGVSVKDVKFEFSFEQIDGLSNPYAISELESSGKSVSGNVTRVNAADPSNTTNVTVTALRVDGDKVVGCGWADLEPIPAGETQQFDIPFWFGATTGDLEVGAFVRPLSSQASSSPTESASASAG